ncbi:nuclear transport factor 2 family protein [Streptomyces sp. CA2R106]|uniref:nuclear transport factor 2 family protein n=1 Tax=Streptomyces sp. CA2R106 TaxID=3120153 RepID=UPI0030093DF6
METPVQTPENSSQQDDDLPPWLAAALLGLASGDTAAWTDVFAEDAVHEFPFAAPGAPQRLEGRAEIATFVAGLSGRIRFGALTDVRVHEAADGTVVIEAEGHHQDAASGAPFDLRYVWVVTRGADGRITRLRDYMGPRRPRTEED